MERYDLKTRGAQRIQEVRTRLKIKLRAMIPRKSPPVTDSRVCCARGYSQFNGKQ